MNKAKIFRKYSVDVIDYDAELSKLNSNYELDLQQNGVTDDVINPILKKKAEDRTYEELLLIVKRKKIEDLKEKHLSIFSEYKDFSVEKEPNNLGEFDSLIPYYVEEGGKVVQKWEIVKDDAIKISAKISRLKKELENSDYKIIKCYEASLTQSPMPYNLEELVAERESKRAEVNRLEELL